MTDSKSNKKQGIFQKFCQETNAPAFGYLVSDVKWGRLFWAVIIAGGIAITSDTIIENWNDLNKDPLYIMTEDFSLELTNVAFPGVAICNINKISKKRVTELARSLSNVTGMPFEEVLHLSKLFGNLYDPNLYGANNISKLHIMLKKYDTGVDRNKIGLLMASLITPCKELIQNCSWDSQDYDCATLFKTRLTDSGFCCLFNSHRPTPEAQFFKEELRNTNNFSKTYSKFPGYGINKGLSVTINNNFNDYFYSSMATKGVVIKIFSPDDYADFTSGSLRQIVVAERLEAFVDITANTITAEKAVRWLNPKVRDCVYKDESENSIGSSTASNCFVDCRIKSMIALCECISFLLPVQSKEYESARVCNLLDTTCLAKYQGKWLRYYPSKYMSYFQNRDSVGIDLEDSLFCRQCLANCEDVTYEIYTYYHDYRSEDPKLYNSSKVHIYSNIPYTRHYQKLVKITWYEALSTLGGIASLISGITIINVVEVIVVFIKKLRAMCENIWS